MKLTLAVALAATSLLAASTAPAHVSKHKIYLSDGFGGDQIRPRGETLLGPATIMLFDLSWKSWGGRQARAHGSWGRRPCSVGCDGAPLTDISPVRVTLSRPRPCLTNPSKVYYRVRLIEFTGRVPRGVKRRQKTVFPCWEDLEPHPSYSPKPLAVHGLTGGVVEIASGRFHSCAVRKGGAVFCWGQGNSGELGDGTGKNHWRPVQVKGLTDAASVDGGESHTCAVTRSGVVKCWGYNSDGQLGTGDLKNRAKPTPVAGLPADVTAVSLGRDHSCALTESGAVWCWGGNGLGALGDGTTKRRLTPVKVGGLGDSAAAIGTGDLFTCAVTTSGAAKCWGYVVDDIEYGPNPVDVPELGSGVTAITGAESHACALTEAGGVKCWGWSSYGELGDGRDETSSTPVEVSGLQSGVTAIDASVSHTCARTDSGAVKCWGSNLAGELGYPFDFDDDSRPKPVAIKGFSAPVTALSAGGVFNCAINAEGGVECWGDNEFGQLGVSAGPPA